MPELPEVETIRLGLTKKIIGLQIRKVEILNPKSFIGEIGEVRGKRVTKIERRAKILILQLDDKALLIHLKMSGQLIYEKVSGDSLPAGKAGLQVIDKVVGGHPTQDMLGKMPNRSTRVIFSFDDGSKLFFNDQRKFGWIKVVDRLQGTGNSLLDSLGPEPLEKEFTVAVLKKQLQKRKKTPVKVAIMDQEVISGVGNIYAAEALFLAKIDPRKRVEKISDKEIKRLHQGIVEALKTGIKQGGSTRSHFVNVEGQKGLFLDYAFVYGRAGQKCKICQSVLQTIRQAGRSTVFCPNCQK